MAIGLLFRDFSGRLTFHPCADHVVDAVADVVLGGVDTIMSRLRFEAAGGAAVEVTAEVFSPEDDIAFVDAPGRTVLWMCTDAAARLVNDLLQHSWPNWKAVFAADGLDAVLTAAGVPAPVPIRNTARHRRARGGGGETEKWLPQDGDHAGRPLSVILPDGHSVLWRIRAELENVLFTDLRSVMDAAGWRPAPGVRRTGWGIAWKAHDQRNEGSLVDSGIHIDPRAQTISWWSLGSQAISADVMKVFEEGWPGWTLVSWGDRFEDHEAAVGGVSVQADWEQMVVASTRLWREHARLMGQVRDLYTVLEQVAWDEPVPTARCTDRTGHVQAPQTRTAVLKPENPPRRPRESKELAAAPDTIDAWMPLAQDLLWTAGPGTEVSLLAAGVALGALSGERFDDQAWRHVHGDVAGMSFGDTGWGTMGRDHARDVLPLAMTDLDHRVDGSSLAMRVEATGNVDVHLLRSTDRVQVRGANGVETIRLAADGDVPEPYRRVAQDFPHRGVSQQADPEAVASAVSEGNRFAEPASPGALRTVQEELGCALPDEVVALYSVAGSGHLRVLAVPQRCCSDKDADHMMLDILPLHHSRRVSAPWHPSTGPFTYAHQWNVGMTPDGEGRVQPLLSSPWWFPILVFDRGEALAVDLAPGPHGCLGQIIRLSGQAPATWVADSLTSLLQRPILEIPHDLRCGFVADTQAHLPEEDAVADGFAVRNLADLASSTDVLEIRAPRAGNEPWDLSGLRRCSSLRVLQAAPGTVRGLETLRHLPRLEYLELGPEEWQEMIRMDSIPRGLGVAAIARDRHLSLEATDDQFWSDGDSMIGASAATANALLEAYGLERIEVVRMHGSLT